MSIGFSTAYPSLQFNSSQLPIVQTEPMLGVYQPVDPSVYSDVYPSDPDPRIREVAELMTEWYQLFIDMRYIEAEKVVFPPHRHPCVDTAQAAAYGLGRDVVDLYQMLPYHLGEPNWNFGSDHGEFLMGGEFLRDMRGPDADWWMTAADPFYAIDDLSPDARAADGATRGWDDDDGPYMRPWYATLTDCGNHGSIMVLDTKTFNMWLIQQLGGTADPVLWKKKHECPETSNRNDLKQYPSRPATEFLRDMTSRFRSLKWIPGGMYHPTDGYYSDYKKLYQECGWSDKFNPILFDSKRFEGGKKYSYWAPKDKPTARQQSYAALNKLYDAMARARETPQQQIHRVDAEYRLEHKMYTVDWERQSLEGRLNGAKWYLNPMDKWQESQAALRTELDFRKSDLEALHTRTGRYAGPGWAGVSDAEIQGLYQEALRDTRIASLEACLADKDAGARNEREFCEAKAAAAATPTEAWDALAADNAKWENDDWPGRWSILGSGTMVVDVRTVVDEDLGLENLHRRIVFELEKNEDRSWKGERLWRNDNGNVTKALQH